MKFSLLFSSMLFLVAQAQETKTIEGLQAGLLGSSLTTMEVNSVTKLTLKGTMDARDFKFMRDSMPLLKELDLSDVNVTSYTGNYGTLTYNGNYSADQLPSQAFYRRIKGSDLTYPTSLILPKTLTSLGSDCFSFCIGLDSIQLSEKIKTINSQAFLGFRGLIQVHPDNPNYADSLGVLYNKKKNLLIQCPTSIAETFEIPNTVDSVTTNSFKDCINISSLHIPESVRFIEFDAFKGCTNLKSVFVCNSPEKIVSAFIFNSIIYPTCTLHVPFGKKNLFATRSYWRSFKYILDDLPGLTVLKNANNLTADSVLFNMPIASNLHWTVSSNSNWLTPAKRSGTGSDTLNWYVAANPINKSRMSFAILHADGLPDQVLQFRQSGIMVSLSSTSGGLRAQLRSLNYSDLMNLKIQGTMDARDFQFIRDSLSSLTFLDLEETVVEAYDGYDGTGSYRNRANVIPASSFERNSYLGVSSLQRLVLPKTITETASSAFANCVALEEIAMPNTLKVLGDYAFEYCTSLKQVDLPDSLISIGVYAFKNCSVSQIHLPNSLNIIKNYAFINCLSLAEVTVPNSVSTLEMGAFYSSGIQSIHLGNGLTNIGLNTFYNCSGLKSVYVSSDVPVALYLYSRVFDYVDKANCVLHVPFGTYSAYSNAIEWKSFNQIVEDSLGILPNSQKIRIAYSEGSKAGIRILSNQSWTVTTNQSWLVASPNSGMGNDSITFTASNNPNLNIREAIISFTTAERAPKSITVTQSATPKVLTLQAGALVTSLTTGELSSISELVLKGSINNRDFVIIRDSMPKLEKLNLAEVHILAAFGLPGQGFNAIENQIPYSAFYSYEKNEGHGLLAEIILPSSCTSIAQNAFRSCKCLENIVIPENVGFIYSDAFNSCTSLEKVRVVGPLKLLAEQAFSNCSKLSEIQLGDSLESIKYYCFSNCKSLKQIILPALVKTLGNGSFSSCSALKEMVIPDNVTELASNCFNSCTGLTKINFGVNLTSIKDYALQGCTSLVSISIPKTVVNIEGWAFNACTGLTSIYANAFTPADISNWYGVFDYVDKAKCTLYVPTGSKTLYANSVRWKDFNNIVELETVISAVTGSALYLFPNPVSSSFQLVGLDHKTVMTIIDTQGRVWLKRVVSSKDQISTEALPKGTYLLHLQGNQVLKFVKI